MSRMSIELHGVSGSENPQGRAPAPVMQGGTHPRDLSVGSNAKAPSLGSDLGTCRRKELQIAVRIGEADEGAKGEPNEREPRLLRGDVEPQFAAIQTFSSAKSQQVQAVVVVAYEEAWRPAAFRSSRRVHVKASERKQAHHFERRPDHRGPFAQTIVAASPFALQDHEGVDADGRVVEKNPAVYVSSIDEGVVGRRNHIHRARNVERDSHIAGEMIERTERKNPERNIRVD